MKRKLFVVSLIGIAMVFAVSCSNKKYRDNTEMENETAKGRFIGEELILPDERWMPMGFEVLQDGTIQYWMEDQVLLSDDGGETWYVSEEMSKVISELSKEEKWMNRAAIDKEGNMFFSRTDPDTWITDYVYITKEGVVRNIELEIPQDEEIIEPTDRELLRFFGEEDEMELTEESRESYKVLYENAMRDELIKTKFSQEGNLFGCSYSGDLYYINLENGEFISIYKGESLYDEIYDFVEVGQKLYVLTAGGINAYDVKTGGLDSSGEVLKEYFQGIKNKEKMGLDIEEKQSRAVLCTDNENEILYFGDETGIYRYTTGSSQLEKVSDGYFSSLMNDELILSKIIAKTDGTFFLLFHETDYNTPHLINYYFSEDAAAVPEVELTVYSLYESKNMGQAIKLFQNNNPNYHITLQVAVTEDNAVTVSDALKILNTEIMAGKGPDILLLDNMPIEAYIESGLLLDLSEIIEELRQDNKYFENILMTHQIGEKIHAVPTRFLIPIVLSAEENIGNIEDIIQLADLMESLEEKNTFGEPILTKRTLEELITSLINVSADGIIEPDGTINDKNLTIFFEQTERICAVESRTRDTDGYGFGGELRGGFQINLAMLMAGKHKIDITEIGIVEDYNKVQALTKSRDWEYQLLRGLNEETFIPLEIVGINAKTQNIEGAQAFIKTMLEEGSQYKTVDTGLPVNADTYERIWKEMIAEKELYTHTVEMSRHDRGNETIIELPVSPLAEQEYRNLERQIASLNVSANINQVITDAITKGAIDYIKGELSIEEAVEKTVQSVNLYLAE